MTKDTSSADGLRRRQLLQTVTAASLTATLAGCQTDFDETTTAGGTTTTTGATTTGGSDTTTEETGTATTTTTASAGDAPAGVEPCVGPEGQSPGPDCNAPKTLDFNVTEDRTIGESCNQYVVDRDVRIGNGATLTVEPGTVVRFEQGTSIEVDESGSLDVAGTCAEPVAFTGTADGRGHWGGIALRGATGNRLRYCVVENAGREFSDLLDQQAAVLAGSGATLAVQHCSIRQNSGYGIALGDDVTVSQFRNNALTDNRDGAASARPATVGAFGPENSYDGNDADVIHVAPGAPLGSGASANWTANGVPYRVAGDAGVEGDLTVEPGTTLEFEPGAALSVRGGGLTATADSDDPITFTGTEKTRGHWRGIHLDATGEDDVDLRGCVVEYGGSGPHPVVDEAANLAVTGNSSIVLENCTLRESRGYGLAVDEVATLSTFAGNELTGNRAGAAAVPSGAVPQFTSANSYAGNANDVIDVTVAGPIPEGTTRTWASVDANYRIRGALSVEGRLTIEPGATLAFTPRSSLEVAGGVLEAEGRERNRITFTGARKQPGVWQGILVGDTGEEPTRLRNCLVEYAGGEPYPDADRPANLTVLNGAAVEVESCEIRRSNEYGLGLRERARVRGFENNVVTNNATGAAYVRLRAASALDGSSTYAGNEVDQVYVRADERIPGGASETWSGIDVPYLVDGDVTVLGSLEVEPGATLQMEQDTAILVRSGGTFNAVGTENDRIRITGTEHHQGHWQGIYFENTGKGTNEIRHSVVEFGGGGKFIHATAPANVAVTTSSYAAVTNCALESSGGYGIHATSGTTVQLSDNTYRFNDLGASDINR